jgi:hypothetical protein
MNQIDFLEMIRTMIDNGEIELYEGQRKECLKIVDDIYGTLMEHWKQYIIKEIQSEDCCNPSEVDYDSWYCWFGDSDGSEIEAYMRALFTEEECENIWQDSHKDKE